MVLFKHSAVTNDTSRKHFFAHLLGLFAASGVGAHAGVKSTSSGMATAALPAAAAEGVSLRVDARVVARRAGTV